MSYAGGSCDRKEFFSEIARSAAGLGLAAAVAPTMAAAKEVHDEVGLCCCCCCCFCCSLGLLLALPLLLLPRSAGVFASHTNKSFRSSST